MKKEQWLGSTGLRWFQMLKAKSEAQQVSDDISMKILMPKYTRQRIR